MEDEARQSLPNPALSNGKGRSQGDPMRMRRPKIASPQARPRPFNSVARGYTWLVG